MESHQLQRPPSRECPSRCLSPESPLAHPLGPWGLTPSSSQSVSVQAAPTSASFPVLRDRWLQQPPIVTLPWVCGRLQSLCTSWDSLWFRARNFSHKVPHPQELSKAQNRETLLYLPLLQALLIFLSRSISGSPSQLQPTSRYHRKLSKFHRLIDYNDF